MTPIISKWLSLIALVKGQANAQDTLNNWADTLDLCNLQMVCEQTVDASALASTRVLTVPTDRTFAPLLTIIRPTSLSTMTSGTPHISIGSNSSSYNNLVTNTALDIADYAKYGAMLHMPTSMAVVTGFAGGTDLFCKINTAASGPYLVEVDLIGWLLP